MRRLWQSTMIGLARSPRAKRWMQGTRSASSLATRYVAGDTAASGVERARLLARDGVKSSLFYLGEYVDRPELLAENVSAKLEVAALLGDAGLDVHVSVDPTQIGCLVDPNLARQNARRIAEAVFQAAGNRIGVHALMLDMEDESVTDATIALHDELADTGLPVALILKLRDLDEYDDAELVRKKIEACFAAFVTGAEDEETLGAAAIAADGHRVEAFEPGMIEYLAPGKV